MKFFKFPKNKKTGQAMTEIVLLIPVFVLVLFIIMKIFALLVLVQKLEIAACYAARRWQLESHRNVDYILTYDQVFLLPDIQRKVERYMGFHSPAVRSFLNISSVNVDITRMNVWNQVVVQVQTRPANIPLLCRNPGVCTKYGSACSRGYRFLCTNGASIEVVKFVFNRDRPLLWTLPGIQ